MKYKEIVSVTGEAGLFQLISSKSDGAIVRSLDGKNTKFIPSRNHNFTPLESIEVFTSGENVMLADVFKAMKENESVHPVPGTNADNKVVKGYFQQIFPSLDEERVYQSDMKKMLKWYPQLKNADLLKFEEEQVEEEKTEEPEETVHKEAVEEPKKKAKNKEQPVKAKETKTSTKKEDTKKKASAAKDKTSDTKEKASSKKTKK
ncbi:MAG: hypothetical protein EPN37_11650 [Chitinophagaceae bacterium]|nr:MAG: hypothetical protein EPN37_11650 [Chitinophagaceae bacterium]